MLATCACVCSQSSSYHIALGLSSSEAWKYELSRRRPGAVAVAIASDCVKFGVMFRDRTRRRPLRNTGQTLLSSPARQKKSCTKSWYSATDPKSVPRRVEMRVSRGSFGGFVWGAWWVDGGRLGGGKQTVSDRRLKEGRRVAVQKCPAARTSLKLGHTRTSTLNAPSPTSPTRAPLHLHHQRIWTRFEA